MYCPYSKAGQGLKLETLPGITAQSQEIEPWHDDDIQFARLISEAQTAGAFTASVMLNMADAMDLEMGDLDSLIDRACDKYDKIKSEL